ncbi:MAG: NAD-dependent deacetylase [Deltaproteobacteria bacterium]|nr:NAD-dependent deacetylase [Deltaproteobacteria bacterium]
MTAEESILKAAKAIKDANALLIAAGAGMGVDSGLPDFRGDEGFWKAYPPLKHLGISFVDMANPAWFRTKPRMAWAFYGHRFFLYCSTVPHEGFSILKRWSESKEHGAFVFTSNVDGQFEKAGFGGNLIYECHGSINHLQCLSPCSDDIWKAADLDFDVDLSDMTIEGAMPRCKRCEEIARPNVLMFGDCSWVADRTDGQRVRLDNWLGEVDGKKLVIIECGAGTAVPTVRMNSEAIQRSSGATLVRINTRESFGPAGTISIPTGALEGIRLIDKAMKQL